MPYAEGDKSGRHYQCTYRREPTKHQDAFNEEVDFLGQNRF
jgi:hypothetical protein